MKAKVIEDADVVTYVVVCDPGDEAVETLNQFVRDESAHRPCALRIVSCMNTRLPRLAGTQAACRTTG
jgi:hypothetical protein